ncbi:MAG: hypothetical protein EZS28_029843 [Streblomastix strix]|uniref:Uncharacterized protein n=1 Tax=Streblomastix strix TaxID=222440 RepID=A0A5J4UXM9_9EUKA|nr:MAG: hypothetical protein EZS28_029843 [Streblomastix strix]
MSFVQPAVIRGDQIEQSVNVPKPLPKEQVKTEPKVKQIQQQVPPSLNPNMLIGIIPNRQYAQQKGKKIIQTNKPGCSTVAFNPIISSGIVRFAGFFEDPDEFPYFSIGIADSSAVFGSNEFPYSGENQKETVCYWNGGEISHIGGNLIPGNSGIKFEKLQYSSSKGVSNGKVFEWGKRWERE